MCVIFAFILVGISLTGLYVENVVDWTDDVIYDNFEITVVTDVEDYSLDDFFSTPKPRLTIEEVLERLNNERVSSKK